MRLSFPRMHRWSAPTPQLYASFLPVHVQAAQKWVDALRDGDHVFADLRAACEASIGASIRGVAFPLMLQQAGFAKYRRTKRKITMYYRGPDAMPRPAARIKAASDIASEINAEAAHLFSRWTRQLAIGVYTFATLRDSFMEWCVDGQVGATSDVMLASMLKDAGFIRYRVGPKKLTIYEKPASAQSAAA